MWIRQLSVYELRNAEPGAWNAALREHPIEDPAPGNRTAVGFAPMPAWGENQEPLFVDHHNNLFAFMGVQAERHLPTQVVDREVRARLKAHRKQHDGPLEKDAKEKLEKEIRAQVIASMLDDSPVKERQVMAVFDDRQHRLYVFSASKQAEDVVLAGLKKALGSSLDAAPIISVHSPSQVLTGWLAAGDAPEPFTLGQDAELASQGGDGGKVVFKGLELDDELIRQHLEEGDSVTKLALTWDGRLDLVITYKGEIQKIAPPGDKMKPQDVPNIWLDAMSLVIPMYDAVMKALGGASRREANIEVEEKPIRVAVVAGEGGNGLPEHVFRLLEQLSQRRPLGELIIPTVPNDRMRAAFRWGAHKKLPIKTVQLTEDQSWATDVISLHPRAVLTFGSGPEVAALASAAADKKIPIMELVANRG